MMHIAPSANPQEIQNYLEQNTRSGQILVRGISNDLHPCIQHLFATWKGKTYYFLCSGDKLFHVPCYLTGKQTAFSTDLPSVEAILDGIRGSWCSPQFMVRQFEQELARKRDHSSPLIIIECLTPPLPEERTFIELLLALSTAHQGVTTALFLHQHTPVRPEPSDLAQNIVQEQLLLLYLCGGRVRATDWFQLTRSQDDTPAPFLTTRCVGSEIWLCYARCQDAPRAAAAFAALTPGERERLARKILDGGLSSADYPILSLANSLTLLDLPLARRTFPPLPCALAEPRAMAKYFYHLRRCAQRCGDSQLVSHASFNYLASLLCCPNVRATRLYHVLRHHPLNDDKRGLARLYGELGQRLVKSNEAPLLEAAAECFRLSRASIDAIENLTDEERQSARAAIANGEALLAFKQGQPELACQIEQTGLHGLQSFAPSFLLAAQEALLRTNLADVYLRLLNNREAALMQYQRAYHLALQWSSPKIASYVVPKLAKALIRAGQPQRAIEILEAFLARPASGSAASAAIEEKVVLTTRLLLAQVYWQSGSYRRAALWYWCLLQKPYGLAPATLKGISGNLQHCRPQMSPRLRARLQTIITNQEEMLASIKQVRACLVEQTH